MRMKTHKHRAAELLESHGWLVADVESWIPHTRIKRDLFGFADLLAVHSDKGTLAVQVTSCNGGHVAERVAKLLNEPNVLDCLFAGWLVEVWGIRDKPTKKGGAVDVRRLAISIDKERMVAGKISSALPPAITTGVCV